jgi:HAD superfamily hydrolase (TIGR01509 family)
MYPEWMPPIRAVLFDLDDTLFDHSYSVRASLSALREAHPALASRPLDDLERDYHALLDEIHIRFLRGHITAEEARTQRFRDLFAICGHTVTADDAALHSERYRAVYQDVRRAVPGALALLDRLRGTAIVGVVTNNITAEQEEKLRVTGMERRIDFMVTAEDAGSIKPDPGIFHEAVRRAGCRPSEAVMLGDAWVADVEGALSAGLHAVWFNRKRLPVPKAGLVPEIRALEPAESVAQVLLSAGATSTAAPG